MAIWNFLQQVFCQINFTTMLLVYCLLKSNLFCTHWEQLTCHGLSFSGLQVTYVQLDFTVRRVLIGRLRVLRVHTAIRQDYVTSQTASCVMVENSVLLITWLSLQETVAEVCDHFSVIILSTFRIIHGAIDYLCISAEMVLLVWNEDSSYMSKIWTPSIGQQIKL